MAKHILEFSKSDEVKYVSHLDLVRMFGRAMRRAEINISFSNGFNPHPIMNFAHPLGVGISSECELIEIGVEGEISSDEFLNKLSKSMPEGFKLKKAKKSETKSPFSELALAKYVIELEGSFENLKGILDKKEIITEKKTKSGVKEADVRPLIKSIEILSQTDSKTTLEVVLSCGGENMKPELFIKVIEEQGLGEAKSFKIHRKALLKGDGSSLVEFQG